MVFFLFGIVGMSLGLFFSFLAFHKRLHLAKEELRCFFKSLALETMEQHSKIFLELAKVTFDKYQESAKYELDSRQKAIDGSLLPLKETLKKMDENLQDLEKKRVGAYAALSTQLEGMVVSEKELRQEMVRLVHSLRSPQIRGSWGQVHLRRVIELAGMINHCDFFEQQSVDNEGRLLRPDLLIRLPGQRQIVIDAKTPLNAYLDASDAGDEELRKKKLQEHATALKRHMRDLAAKEYWKQFESAPEYVILFLPAEAFYSAALQADPALIETGATQNVLIATPTTLIAILRAVALTWKQESLSKNARDISQLGQELYNRIGVFCEHWNKVGKSLNGAVESFNQSGASLESRVLVSIRKLKEIGQIQKEMVEISQIEKNACMKLADHF